MAIKKEQRERLANMTDAELLVESAFRITMYAGSEKDPDRITDPEAHYFECFWLCSERGLREEFERLKTEIMAQRRRESERQWARIQALGVK